MGEKLTLRDYLKQVAQKIALSFKPYTDIPSYCIVGIRNLELTNVENIELLIQVVGKTQTFTAFPKDLYKDDSLLDKFSNIEVRTITILGLIQENKYKLTNVELESIKYYMDQQMAIFIVEGSGEKIERNINELPWCEQLINKLSPIEAFRLGMSYESQQKS